MTDDPRLADVADRRRLRDDATFPARHAERLARERGSEARLVTVAGSGHMVNLTHPVVVNAALVQLLERIEHPDASRPAA